MSAVYRVNRKAKDEDIIRLNSLGFSLSFIAERLNCHPTTVTLRLQSLGIAPADTRRTFMEDIYKGMTEAQLDLLAEQLGPHLSIKDYIRNMLAKSLITQASPI